MALSHACFDSWAILRTLLYRGQWPCSDCLVPFTETFTVEDALEAIGFGKFQVKMCFLTGLSWVRILKHAERPKLRFPDTVCLSCSAPPLWEQIADAMEMMILSILGPHLHCEWRLPSYKMALITSVRSSRKGLLILQCVKMFTLNIFFFFLASGGVCRDGYQFPCVGQCVRQVWQKSSESHIWLVHKSFGDFCKLFDV